MTHSTALKAIVALGLLMAANGFVLGPMWLLDGAASFGETADGWAFAASQRTSWALLMLLIPLVPALLAERGSDSLVTPLVQVGFAAQSATAFAMGFVAPWLAGIAPELLDESQSGGVFFIAMTTAWVASGVVTVTLAVVLARGGRAGRVAPALIGLGALVVPGVGPIGWGFIGVGLALAAGRSLRAAESEPRPARRRQTATGG